MPRRNRNASRSKSKATTRRSRLNSSQVTSCRQKNSYRTQAEAERAAEIQMLSNMSLELDVYHCPVCQQWHLTRNNYDQ